MSALEEAYKSVGDTGRFPFCVLNIKIDEASIDINVHPQKREIKFSDEKKIYSAVYYAVRNALETGGGYDSEDGGCEDNELDIITDIEDGVLDVPQVQVNPSVAAETTSFCEMGFENTGQTLLDEYRQSEKIYNLDLFNRADDIIAGEKYALSPKSINYKILGEAFYGYIILEKEQKIIIIDKHAAHERIIYDIILKRAEDNKKSSQVLLEPLEIKLNAEETAGILNIALDLKKIGIEFEWHGDNIIISAVAGELAEADIVGIIKEAAYISADGEAGAVERLAEIAANKYAACRAAMKSGMRDMPEDLIWLADRVINYEDVKYCPHGRPVAFELAKSEIEKRLGR